MEDLKTLISMPYLNYKDRQNFELFDIAKQLSNANTQIYIHKPTDKCYVIHRLSNLDDLVTCAKFFRRAKKIKTRYSNITTIAYGDFADTFLNE